jgi:uncharacterized protein (UPF0332 family)
MEIYEHLQEADDFLAEAERAFELELYRSALNDAFYVAVHAVEALLAKHHWHTPTHTRRWEILDANPFLKGGWLVEYERLERLRRTLTYRGFHDGENVKNAIDLSKSVLDAIKKQVGTP